MPFPDGAIATSGAARVVGAAEADL